MEATGRCEGEAGQRTPAPAFRQASLLVLKVDPTPSHIVDVVVLVLIRIRRQTVVWRNYVEIPLVVEEHRAATDLGLRGKTDNRPQRVDVALPPLKPPVAIRLRRVYLKGCLSDRRIPVLLRVKAHLRPAILDSDGNYAEVKDEIVLDGFPALHADENTRRQAQEDANRRSWPCSVHPTHLPYLCTCEQAMTALPREPLRPIAHTNAIVSSSLEKKRSRRRISTSSNMAAGVCRDTQDRAGRERTMTTREPSVKWNGPSAVSFQLNPSNHCNGHQPSGPPSLSQALCTSPT